MLRTWLDASRWVYNLTVEILQHGVPAAWKYVANMVVPELKLLHPEWKAVPYQVKRTAVRDACRAMSNVKIFNMTTGRRQGQEAKGWTRSSPNCTSAAGRIPGSPATSPMTP